MLAVSAVVVPRISSTLGSSATTGTASSSTVITQHDLVEHRADTAAAIDRARISSAIERQATHEGKLRASQVAAATAGLTGVRVGESTVSQQVGGLAPTFPYAPAASPKFVYNGRDLVELGAAVPAVAASTLRQQVGGRRRRTPTPPPRGPTSGRQRPRARAAYAPTGHAHLAWTDPWVPPYDNPEWVPYIKSHYFSPTTTPTRPTHEFR